LKVALATAAGALTDPAGVIFNPACGPPLDVLRHVAPSCIDKSSWHALELTGGCSTGPAGELTVLALTVTPLSSARWHHAFRVLSAD